MTASTFTEHTVIGFAADLIAAHGFAVGEFVTDDGPDRHGRLCPLGALSEAIFGDPLAASTGAIDETSAPWLLYFDAVLTLTEHLVRTGDPIYKERPTINGWSDKAGRDVVLAAMWAAAAGDVEWDPPKDPEVAP
jgi:hypothetical protein